MLCNAVIAWSIVLIYINITFIFRRRIYITYTFALPAWHLRKIKITEKKISKRYCCSHFPHYHRNYKKLFLITARLRCVSPILIVLTTIRSIETITFDISSTLFEYYFQKFLLTISRLIQIRARKNNILCCCHVDFFNAILFMEVFISWVLHFCLESINESNSIKNRLLLKVIISNN